MRIYLRAGCALLIALVMLCTPASAAQDLTYRLERLWPTLQQPWYFYRPAGVAVDSDGNFYVADTSNNRVRKFTSDGQFITQWGRHGSEPGQMGWPTGMAFGPDGLLYVADRFNDRIQKFDRLGKFIGLWTTHTIPTGVAVDAAGFVYVTYGDNLRVEKFSPEGELLDEYVGDGTKDPSIESCSDTDLIPCEWPPGIAVDSLGHVFVTDPVNFRVIRLGDDLEFQLAFGDQGQDIGPAGSSFGVSFGIAIDAQGDVYVSDVFNARIQKFDNDGVFLDLMWGTPGNGPGDFGEPHALTIDGKGNVFVTDTSNDRIQKFTSKGEFINQWGSLSTRESAMDYPGDVAVDADGNVYVADTLNSRIQKFASDGQFIKTWGQEGRGDPNLFVSPEGIAVSPSGEIYVADTYSGDESVPPRVAVFSRDGVFARDWLIPNVTGDPNPEIKDEFVFPTGVAVDGEGNVYVCQTSYLMSEEPDVVPTDPPIRNRVQKFAADGTLLTEWGSFGEGDGQFLGPVAVAVDADGFVYVAESGSVDCTGVEGECPLPNEPPRIQKFTSDGEFVLKWGGYGTEPGRFDEPSGIAIDNDGNVLVADSQNNRIQKFTPDGVFIQEFGGLGDSPGQFLLPAGLDVALDGSIYTADSRHSRIQHFRPIAAGLVNKAVIVAGGGDSQDNELWAATQMCANMAYRSLVHQGFDKDTIVYLSSDSQLDFDSNLQVDDVSDATAEVLEDTMVRWAADADNVIIYITGLGNETSVQLSETESVQITEILSWLFQLEQSIPGKVVIIYDGPKSGSFQFYMPPAGEVKHIIITGSDSDEAAYFLTNGTLSFSNHFWLGVFNGLGLLDAFNAANEALSVSVEYQHPLLDANGNGVANEYEDFAIAATLDIFSGTDSFDDAPEVSEVSPSQELAEDETTATFFAKGVSDDQDAIARIWAVITPPSFQAKRLNPLADKGLLPLAFSGDKSSHLVVELPSFDLEPTGEGEFTADFDGFDEPGTYQVDIYALDGNLNLAPVSSTSVQKAGLLPAVLTCSVWDDDVAENTPILNATVSLDPGGLTVTDNTEGLYTFAAVPADTYNVSVTASGYRSFSSSITLTSGEIDHIDAPMHVDTGQNPADINLDGSINAVDVQLVINAALGIDISPFTADVNNDSRVNASDVQLVINAALGL